MIGQGRTTMQPTPTPSFDPVGITRPSPVLLNYYLLAAAAGTLCIIPLTIIALLPNLFKYHSLRYRFDDEGVSMAWGVLFRREINLTYRRIQDIHVTRNLFQRWMGLATVAIQTASGSSTPEMSIEGILEVDQLRDFLYSKMRGARGEVEEHGDGQTDDSADEALRLLREIRDEIVALRRAGGSGGGGVT
jgi:putative membrane protein